MSTLTDGLHKADIQARDYKRAPAGKDNFIVGIDRRKPLGEILTWQGASEFDLKLSKKHRQAVINVEEVTRSFDSNIEYNAAEFELTRNGNLKKATLANMVQRTQNRAKSRPQGLFEIDFPRAPRVTVHADRVRLLDQTPKTLRQYPGMAGSKRVIIPVTATVPSSRQSLLVGMDESFHFVAALPEKYVNSVADAHELLRPERAEQKRNVLRQGEWFFIPVRDDGLKADLEELVAKGRLFSPAPLETNSTHWASILRIEDGRRFAAGYVTDRRAGHHQPVWLGDWHEIVRNNEVRVRRSAPPRRYWD